MKTLYDILEHPLMTEKTMLEQAKGKYTFRVHRQATKREIKEAVERIFGVKVAKVNTSRVSGHRKRVRYAAGYTPDWKKAVVSLKPGEKIDITESGKGA